MLARTFHVLYLPDGPMASCIDAIRVLANPAEKYKAHITVRGPYKRGGFRLGSVNRILESSEIEVRGAGNFFSSGQNTVYLRCESPNLKAVWDKADFGFNPHITLYDGPSSAFARELWRIISSRPYEFSFVAGPLTPLVSKRRSQGGMALQADLDFRLLQEVAQLDADEVTIESLSQSERLNAIDKLSNFLSNVDRQMDTHRQAASNDGSPASEIVEVDVNSPLLSSIKAVARKNSSTLGFLPDGAFDAYARRRWILAAIEGGTLAGYVIYRVSRMRAVLVHLCTEQSHRRKGIARQLFDSVVARTADQRGILANTRRDFPAHSMWPRLGFTAIGEGPGRGTKGTVLTRWWYQHPHPTLFSNTAPSVTNRSPIDVAIDLNVFYDLVTPSIRDGSDESRSLQSDWLMDEIQLCVTGELFNEINRLQGSQERTRQRNQAHEFKLVSGTAETFVEMHSRLTSILGESKNDRQSSDLRHLAHTAAAEVEYFVTRDAKLLKNQSAIEGKTGVTPLRPADLVIELDQIRNTASYQPVRFRGSTLQVAKVNRKQRHKLEDAFVSKSIGENKAAFRRVISAILPSHPSVDSSVVLDENGEPIALFGIDWTNPSVANIPCLRLRHGRMARTLARQIVSTAIESSIAHHRSILAVSDNWLESFTEEALAECGFFKAGPYWLKLNYAAIGTLDQVSAGIEHLLEEAKGSGFNLPGSQRIPLQPECQLNSVDTVLLERNLRPLKLINGSLNSIVIPVRPLWAHQLFDSGLSEQTLFGARPDLLLTWENVYYRSSRSFGEISSPFRILWYVSHDRRYSGTGQIRAYSVGSSIEVLPAHAAFNRYKRLGVYSREQVLEITGGDPNGQVMVIRFCDIELFKSPIDRSSFSTLLEDVDKKRPSLRGPQRISEMAFANIYREGQR